MFASIVMLGLWAGFNLDGLEILVPVGVGVTLYGAAYALVHDGWIHRRVGWFDGSRTSAARSTVWRPLTGSTTSTNGAPFGMLMPGRSAPGSRSAGGLH